MSKGNSPILGSHTLHIPFNNLGDFGDATKDKKLKEDALDDLLAERKRMNQIVLGYYSFDVKSIYNLDSLVYNDGAPSRETKELMMLVCSLVLRCDDCVIHHVIRCYEKYVSDAELEEGLPIDVIIGGTIVILYLRRIFDLWEKLKKGGYEKEEFHGSTKN